MFDLNEYLNELIRGCQEAFGSRLLYVGLQGSWLRGEAREGSDIDVMVVLDRLSVKDMDRYREILQGIGAYERSCGFLCGRDELLRWSPLESCQLRFTTKDLVGTLTELLPPAGREDELEYVKFGLGNLYHEICHRYIHADRQKNAAKFRGTCKNVFFLIQNLHFLESGRFLLTRRELKEAVSAEDRLALELAELPDGFDFDRAFAALYGWCKRAFLRLDCLKKGFTVRRLTEEETAAALELAWKVFCACEAPDYGPEGTEEFRRSIRSEDYLAGIVYYGAFAGEQLIGVLGIREERRHICFFFVDGAFQRRGIGTALFLRMREDFPGQTITLNSSPYGLPFYKALGFAETDAEQTVRGIRFTPMRYPGETKTLHKSARGENNGTQREN